MKFITARCLEHPFRTHQWIDRQKHLVRRWNEVPGQPRVDDDVIAGFAQPFGVRIDPVVDATILCRPLVKLQRGQPHARRDFALNAARRNELEAQCLFENARDRRLAASDVARERDDVFHVRLMNLEMQILGEVLMIGHTHVLVSFADTKSAENFTQQIICREFAGNRAQ